MPILRSRSNHHTGGFEHPKDDDCFLFIMQSPNGLSEPRAEYLKRLYAAWNSRVEPPPVITEYDEPGPKTYKVMLP